MRILHISKYYSPYLGGVENICKYLVEGAVKHETAVVCFNDKCKDVIMDIRSIELLLGLMWLDKLYLFHTSGC